ncbi:uncharacterized protein LOC124491545 [Dermatophagoides farinae]|uniref:uncharacterized protein LOC124491545 n=1 Tax=Dermatophagoides farinae TaxID=6954 RepID=UPI003F625904
MLISYIILLILACIIGITFQQLKTNRIARWIPEPCSICDKIIFIFLGMVLIQNEHNWNWIFISYAIIFCIFYRFIAIIMLTFFVNHYWISRWSKLLARRWIKFKEQILLVHVGLRGAIAFALISTSYNGQEINHHEEYISKLESTKTIMDRNFFWQQHQHLLAYRLVDILIFIRKNQLCMKDKSILSRILIFWNKYYQKNNNDGSSYINCYDLQSKSSSPINMSTYHLFQTTTLFIIIFTVFIMGSTTRPLLTYLKIVIDDNDKRQTKISDKSPSDYRLRLKSNEQLFASLNNQLFNDISKSIFSLMMASTTTSIQNDKISTRFRMIKWLQSGYRYFRQMLIQPPSHQNQIDFSHDDDWNDGEIYDPSNKFGNESDFHHPYTMIIISHVLSNNSSNHSVTNSTTTRFQNFNRIHRKLFLNEQTEQNFSNRKKLWSFKTLISQNLSHFGLILANFRTKIVSFFLIINGKIKAMVNKCNLRSSSSSIVHPVTIDTRSDRF